MPRPGDLHCDASHFNRNGAGRFTHKALALSDVFASNGAVSR